MPMGDHLKGSHARSSYLGYDCYVNGQIGGQRKLRCVLRPRRIPQNIAPDVRAMLPPEFYWPTPVHEEAHRCVDAIYQLDVKTLAGWHSQFPDHLFSLSAFMDFARRWIAANRDKPEVGSAPAEDVYPGERAEDADARATPAAAAPAEHLFPVWVKHVAPIKRSRMGDIELRWAVVYFKDGEPAVRLDLYPVDADIRLTRLYADMLDAKKVQVVEHYPGRYRGLGLSLAVAAGIMGRKAALKRRTLDDDPRVVDARKRASLVPPSERQIARQTLERARSLYGREEVFAPHLLPTLAH